MTQYFIPTNLTKQEPMLGLASTEELMRELIARWKISAIAGESTYANVDNALTLAEMLGRMDAETREYRTVGHE